MTEFNAHRDIEGDMPPDTPPKPLAGDHADDDGRALDDYFEAMPSGPQPFAGSVWTGPEPSPHTRILQNFVRLSGGNGETQAIQLLPPDPNRIQVSVSFLSLYGQRLYIASSMNELNGAAPWYPENAQALYLPPGPGSPVEGGNTSILNVASNARVFYHTGAIWCKGIITSGYGEYEISAWAVTS